MKKGLDKSPFVPYNNGVVNNSLGEYYVEAW